MDIKRTTTMTWDGLGGSDDEEDQFFESKNRISSVVPLDLPSSGSSDDEDFDDSRMSFASCISSISQDDFRRSNVKAPSSAALENYDIWMAAPGSIEERRKRLLQGMGLTSKRDLLRVATIRAISRKFVDDSRRNHQVNGGGAGGGEAPRSVSNSEAAADNSSSSAETESPLKKQDNSSPNSASPSIVLFRSRSDGDIEFHSADTKRRKEQLIGEVSKQRLTRTSSSLAPCTGLCRTNPNAIPIARNAHSEGHNKAAGGGGGSGLDKRKSRGGLSSASLSNGQFGAVFLIKNLDTGKEFIVKEYDEDGMWNRLSDLQTGKQMTMEEFEKSVGYSPVVKELMRRENVNGAINGSGADRKAGMINMNSLVTRSFRYSKRRGLAWLKNIRSAATSVTGGGSIIDKERDQQHSHGLPIEPPPLPPSSKDDQKHSAGGNGKTPSTEWVKVRQQGKSYKELTALRLCQEIRAHQGSIWTIKFSLDGRYLASAGEDKVIQVWEVQECEIASLRYPEDGVAANATPVHQIICPSPDRPPLPADFASLDKKKKGKSASRKGNVMPDYVHLPETVFALSETPVCSLTGHLDDVLDLSWSESQLLLSSSMDKTVRLWDLEQGTCLKLFAHNDYVTCIQFNPANDDYFISGSLDAKVRIWSIPGRRVVDWTDLHEMVTAASYTPDGMGAAVGSHKGNCRMYSIADGKLNQISQFDIQQNKKKATPKKITGFQFLPENPAEVLVTSADSRIRIYDGSDVIQKFRGLRNTSSQIAATFSPDGKYVICASEDSNVYVWKREESRTTNGKNRTVINTKSYEHFQCKDVSVAIPWPGSIKFEAPTIQLHSKRHSKRLTGSSVTTPQQPHSCSGSPRKEENNTHNNKRSLPPLPTKTKEQQQTATKATANTQNNSIYINGNGSGSGSGHDNGNENESAEKNTGSGNSSSINTSSTEKNTPTSPEADPSKISRTESGMSESFSSSSTGGASVRLGESPSISYSHSASPSWSPGWSWFDAGGAHGNDKMQATAWGLVIVTAGLGGEIRAYQNIGLPLRVGRQANLFRDLT